MDISQLRQIAAVADTGSIAAASDQLYISRPAISKSLSKLESELGFALFRRSASGVTLTEEGARLLPLIRQAVSAFETVEGEMAALRPSRDVVRIGFSFGTNPFFESALCGFQAAHPQIQIESSPISDSDAVSALRAGQFDLCCCGRRTEETDIRQYPILRDRVLYAVPRSSVPAKRGYLKSEELRAGQLLGPSGGNHSTFVRRDEHGGFQNDGVASANYNGSDDMLYLFHCVKQGAGFLAMPEGVARHYAVEDIVFVPEENSKYWEVYVLFFEDRLNWSVRQVLNAVFHELSDESAPLP